MKRKEFLKSACTLGVCSCAAFGFLTNTPIEKSKDTPVDESDKILDFTKKRFAKLLKILNSSIGEEEKKNILETLGRECSKENQEFLC